MPSVPNILQAIQELGIRNLMLYAAHQTKLRSGWYRHATPMYKWTERHLSWWVRSEIPTDSGEYLAHRELVEKSRRFFFASDDDLQGQLIRLQYDLTPAIQEAAELEYGGFRLFGGPSVPLGMPPVWGAAPGSEVRNPTSSQHWSELSEKYAKDIKLIWEPSRFAWTYPLARAYRFTGDVRYARIYWALITSWLRQNSPYSSPNWSSAQEVALRLLATVFGWYAFAPFLRKAPERLVTMAGMLAAFADRIPYTLDYARSQANNHLLSEACSLYTVGLLFPEFKKADSWKKLGRKWLIRGFEEQIFDDGGYIQHSSNYHRMALSLGLWAARLAEINGEPFPDDLLGRFRTSALCLHSQINSATGRSLNFGHNDGSHVLPLTSCVYGDYRPLLQAAGVAFCERGFFPVGSWDEMLIWLGYSPKEDGNYSGAFAGSSTSEMATRSEENLPWIDVIGEVEVGSDAGWGNNKARSYPEAGFEYLQGEESWAMLRSARFKSRPAHSDQLNLDIWWKGVNVIRDMGSFSYNAAPPWDNPFARALAHNAPVIEGVEPMHRAGKFLWLNWAQSRILGRQRSSQGIIEFISAEHDGYRKHGIIVRRAVLRAGDDLWLIIDDLFGAGFKSCSWNWTLPDWDWSIKQGALIAGGEVGEMCIQVQVKDKDCSLHRGGEHLAIDSENDAEPTAGWISPTYNLLEPALSWRVKIQASFPQRVLTWITFNRADPSNVQVEYQPLKRELLAIHSAEYEQERLIINGGE